MATKAPAQAAILVLAITAEMASTSAFEPKASCEPPLKPNHPDHSKKRVALAKVKEDKEREVQDGFDSSWVAHHDLVSVCTDVFSEDFEEGRINQKHLLRQGVQVTPDIMLNFQIPKGKITEPGLHYNISVGIQHIAAWLKGTGAVIIFNLIEDAATAEIGGILVWQ